MLENTPQQSAHKNAHEQDAYYLDKRHVRTSFNAAARSYDAAAVLQRQVREDMLSRLALIKVQPKTILDAGCGTGHGVHALQQRFAQAQTTALDIAPAMLAHTRRLNPWYAFWKKSPTLVCADIEQLPLATASMDMLWSNLAIQWCNDLDTTLQGFKRVLRPNGLLMFSTLGPDTLKELRQAAAQGDDAHTHVSRFLDMHDIGDALTRAGFSDPVLDVMHYTLTYDDVQGVMRDLKAIGANNATVGRPRGLKGRGFLKQLNQGYEVFRQHGKLPATYEVVFAHAWLSPSAHLPEGVNPLQFVPKRPAKA